ncbi:hypothetical protein D3C78_19420 [compost metagenome]
MIHYESLEKALTACGIPMSKASISVSSEECTLYIFDKKMQIPDMPDHLKNEQTYASIICNALVFFGVGFLVPNINSLRKLIIMQDTSYRGFNHDAATGLIRVPKSSFKRNAIDHYSVHISQDGQYVEIESIELDTQDTIHSRLGSRNILQITEDGISYQRETMEDLPEWCDEFIVKTDFLAHQFHSKEVLEMMDSKDDPHEYRGKSFCVLRNGYILIRPREGLPHITFTYDGFDTNVIRKMGLPQEVIEEITYYASFSDT